MSELSNEKNNKEIEDLKEEINFEARQNLLGFFGLLLRIAIRKKIDVEQFKNKKYKIKIDIKIYLKNQLFFIFLIFAILFFLKNEYSYSIICLFLIFLNLRKEKLKEILIGFKNIFIKVKFYK